MDFSPDEGQQAVADVVTSALGRDNSWDALVDGGIAAFGVPERLRSGWLNGIKHWQVDYTGAGEQANQAHAPQ